MKKIMMAVMALSLISGAALAQNKVKTPGNMERPVGPGTHRMMWAGEGRDGMPAGFMKNLPADKQEQAAAIMEKYSSRDKVQKLIEERKTIMTAEKFDAKAFIKNHDKMKDVMEKAMNERVKAMAEVMSILSVEERTKMVEAWEAGPDKIKKKRAAPKKGDKKAEKQGEKRNRQQ